MRCLLRSLLPFPFVPCDPGVMAPGKRVHLLFDLLGRLGWRLGEELLKLSADLFAPRSQAGHRDRAGLVPLVSPWDFFEQRLPVPELGLAHSLLALFDG